MYKDGFVLVNIQDISYIVEYKKDFISMSAPIQMVYEANQVYGFRMGQLGAYCHKHREEYERLDRWCFDVKIEDLLLDRIVLVNKLKVGVPLYKLYHRARRDVAGLGPIHFGVEIQKRILFPAAAVEQIYAIAMSHFAKKT